MMAAEAGRGGVSSSFHVGEYTYTNNHTSGNTQQHNGHNFGNVSGTVHGNVINNFAPTADEASEIRAALFETDPETDRQNLMLSKGERAPKTCEWIKEDENYQSWLRGDATVLSLCGGPGKGKTMLADFIISDVKIKTEGGGNVALTYFFCLNADSKRNNTVSVLRGLLYHLVRTKPKLMEHLAPHMAHRERHNTAINSPETLWSVLMSMASSRDVSILCVLDGLDECNEETHSFIAKRLLGDGAESNSGPTALRFAILSRPLPALNGVSCQIQLDRQNKNDIDLYLGEKLMELRRKLDLDDSTVRRLHEQLIKRAEGTFLWVGFAMAQLLRQKTQLGVEACLEQMPSGLPAMYGRMLNQISAEFKAQCRTILQWAAVAIRPLSIEEMASVLDPEIRVTPFTKYFSRASTEGQLRADQELRITNLLQECGPIVAVQERIVTLIHQSARDYLLDFPRGNDTITTYWRFDRVKANKELLLGCVSCCEACVQQLPAYAKDGTLKWEFPLSRYARENLVEHARLIPPSENHIFGHSFFYDEQCPARTYWNKGPEFTNARKRHDQFFVACERGVYPWLEYLMQHKKRRITIHNPVKARDSSGATLLMHAVKNKNVDMIRLLLEHGAKTNARDGEGNECLYHARWCGPEVIRLLLSSGATLEAKNETGLTVLHGAAKCNNDVAVACLLAHGAHVDVMDNEGRTPLSWAVEQRNNEKVIQVLLEHGADVNARDDEGRTPLLLATASITEDYRVVKCLLKHGADIDLRGRKDRTPLHFAALYGSGFNGVEGITSLLERGAYIDALDRYGWTPLMYAVHRQQFAIVQCLLVAGASVSSRASDGSSPLHLAMGMGEAVTSGLDRRATAIPLKLVRAFLEFGADTKAVNNNGDKPVHLYTIGDGFHSQFSPSELRTLACTTAEHDWIQACIQWGLALFKETRDLFTAHGVDMNEFSESSVHAKIEGHYLTRGPLLYRDDRYESSASKWSLFLRCTSCKSNFSSRGVWQECLDCPKATTCHECVYKTMEQHTGHRIRSLNYKGEIYQESEGWWPHLCDGCDEQIFRLLHGRGDLYESWRMKYCKNCAEAADKSHLHDEGCKIVDVFEESKRLKHAAFEQLKEHKHAAPEDWGTGIDES